MQGGHRPRVQGKHHDAWVQGEHRPRVQGEHHPRVQGKHRPRGVQEGERRTRVQVGQTNQPLTLPFLAAPCCMGTRPWQGGLKGRAADG